MEWLQFSDVFLVFRYEPLLHWKLLHYFKLNLNEINFREINFHVD